MQMGSAVEWARAEDRAFDCRAGLDSLSGLVVFPHSTDREFRDPVGCCWV